MRSSTEWHYLLYSPFVLRVGVLRPIAIGQSWIWSPARQGWGCCLVRARTLVLRFWQQCRRAFIREACVCDCSTSPTPLGKSQLLQKLPSAMLLAAASTSCHYQAFVSVEQDTRAQSRLGGVCVWFLTTLLDNSWPVQCIIPHRSPWRIDSSTIHLLSMQKSNSAPTKNFAPKKLGHRNSLHAPRWCQHPRLVLTLSSFGILRCALHPGQWSNLVSKMSWYDYGHVIMTNCYIALFFLIRERRISNDPHTSNNYTNYKNEQRSVSAAPLKNSSLCRWTLVVMQAGGKFLFAATQNNFEGYDQVGSHQPTAESMMPPFRLCVVHAKRQD